MKRNKPQDSLTGLFELFVFPAIWVGGVLVGGVIVGLVFWLMR